MLASAPFSEGDKETTCSREANTAFDETSEVRGNFGLHLIQENPADVPFHLLLTGCDLLAGQRPRTTQPFGTYNNERNEVGVDAEAFGLLKDICQVVRMDFDTGGSRRS